MAARYTQPQGGPLLLKWDDSLTSKLTLATLPGVNRGYDVVANKLPGAVGVKSVITPTGLAGGFGATLGVATSDRMTTSLSGAFPAAGRTYFFKAKRNGTGGSTLGRLFDKTSGGSGQMLYWYGSQARLEYSFYAGGVEKLTDIPGTNITAAVGETFTVMVTHLQVGTTNTINAWINGVQVLTDWVQTGTFNDAASTPMSIGNRADAVRGWDGLIECAYVWDRLLTGTDAAALHSNPYRIFAPNVRMSPLLMASAASTPATTRTANVTVTEAADTVSSAAKALVGATAVLQEVGDNAASSVAAPVSASGSISEQPDTVVSNIGSVTPVVATVTVTEASDSVTSNAAAQVQASQAFTEQGDTTSSSASNVVTASGIVTEQADTSTASLTSNVTASTTVFEDSDTASSIVASDISVDAAVSETSDGILSVGEIATSATANAFEESDTVVSEISLGFIPINIEAEVSEAGDSIESDVLVADYAAYVLNPQRKVFVRKENRTVLVKKELRIVYAK